MKKNIVFFFAFCVLFNFSSKAQRATVHVKENPMIDQLVDLQAKMTQNNQIGQRYKIQLGSFSAITEAKKIRSQFKAAHQGFSTQIKYEAPNYKVWIGNFTSRLAAERVFDKIKNTFKSALIFKPSA